MLFRIFFNGDPVEPSEPLVFVRLIQPWLNCDPGSVVGVFQDQANTLVQKGVAAMAFTDDLRSIENGTTPG